MGAVVDPMHHHAVRLQYPCHFFEMRGGDQQDVRLRLKLMIMSAGSSRSGSNLLNCWAERNVVLIYSASKLVVERFFSRTSEDVAGYSGQTQCTFVRHA